MTTRHASDQHEGASTELRRYTEARDGWRVLLAEDDEDLRHLLAESLRRRGYAVLTAEGGREALRLFSSASAGTLAFPDAIVMDIRMPAHSGIDLLRALRLAEWQVPVILVTSLDDERTLEQAEAYGAFATLRKPVEALDLARSVQRAIDAAPPPGYRLAAP